MSRITYIILYTVIVNTVIQKSFADTLNCMTNKRKKDIKNVIFFTVLAINTFFDYKIGLQNAGVTFLIQVPILIVMLGYINKKIKTLRNKTR